MNGMTLTEEKIINQLKQNTGRALCDSGGTPQYDDEGNYTGSTQGYGRAWERDAKREFENEPCGTYEIWDNELIPYVSTYHYLTEKCGLFYNQQKDNRLQRFMEEEDLYGLRGMEAFVEELSLRYEITGVYGGGDPMLINTYNYDCVLDRTLQFIYFEWGGESHVILQTHNGADVRGGYSTPTMYEADDEMILFYQRATLWAGDQNWCTDDGYHWYEDGGTAGTNLEDHKFDHEAGEILQRAELKELSSSNPETVYVFEDDEAYIGGDLLELTF